MHHSDVFLLNSTTFLFCFIPIRLCIQERFVSFKSFLFLFFLVPIQWLIYHLTTWHEAKQSVTHALPGFMHLVDVCMIILCELLLVLV